MANGCLGKGRGLRAWCASTGIGNWGLDIGCCKEQQTGGVETRRGSNLRNERDRECRNRSRAGKLEQGEREELVFVIY